MNDKIEAEQVIFYAAQDCAYTGTGAAQPWPPPVIGPAGALKSRRGPAVVVRRSCRSLFVQCRVPQYGWSQGRPARPWHGAAWSPPTLPVTLKQCPICRKDGIIVE